MATNTLSNQGQGHSKFSIIPSALNMMKDLGL